MRDSENIIGKPGWVRRSENDNRHDQSKSYTITQVVKPGEALPDGTTNREWCEKYILTDGVETIVRNYYEVIIATNRELPIDCRIPEYLNDNQLGYEDCSVTSNGQAVTISIIWGDWKHSHGYCDYLMSLLGYRPLREVVTEQNGSDAYSSIHYYVKITLEDIKNALKRRAK